VVNAVRVPVIAGGGIADGRGIAAAFALGASGVQMNTAVLTCPEAATPSPHRRALLARRDVGTRLTRVLSGHWARVLRNRFVEEMAAVENEVLPFPMQFSLIALLRRASVERDSDGFLAMWAGQGASLARALPAGELVETLVEEVRAVLRLAKL
jgi:nitronate monooxygenase